MTKDRYEELSEDIELALTPAELTEGWYWSLDFDGLLIHKTWTEAENDNVGYDPLGTPEELT